MLLFKTLSDSNNKSKLMKNLIMILVHKKNGDKDIAYQELFQCIKTFPGQLSNVVEEYGFTCEEFKSLSQRFMALGFSWQKSDYVPVSIFCFAKPLEYILQNRKVFDGGTYDELIDVTYSVTKLL